jgi:hypothetical protein
MQKPKEWVEITSGPSCGFATARMLLLKGPTRLTCLFYLAPVLLCLTLFGQSYPALNTSTTSSIATIPTLTNPNNSTHYWFLNSFCPSLKPYPKSLSTFATQQLIWRLELA